MVISVNSSIAFELNSVVFNDGQQSILNATGDATANYTTINNSTLTCCGGVGELEYSDTGTSGPWSYSPSTDFSSGGRNYDNDVRAIRISPSGTFADGSSSATGFRFYFKGQIK